jgi:antitoxin (DNA-binding transcriptional repressor) of toxin-antitoxin stability system
MEKQVSVSELRWYLRRILREVVEKREPVVVTSGKGGYPIAVISPYSGEARNGPEDPGARREGA